MARIHACNLLLLASITACLATRNARAEEYTSIIRYEPDGPGGKGFVGPNSKTNASGDSKTTSYYYYRSAGNPRITSGVWEASNFHGPLRKTSATEFIHVVRGIITLGYKDGREEKFKAGDNLLIPRGAEVAWQGTDNVKEYWVMFDPGPSTSASTEDSPAVIKFDRDGPAGKGLTGKGRTKEYEYYSSPEKSSAGVWETEAFTAPKFHTPVYCELMLFLDGTVTLSTPSGQSETFKAGDVALVPKGVAYKWSSDRARKFWVIFDADQLSTTTSK